jgi:hypothetical protein
VAYEERKYIFCDLSHNVGMYNKEWRNATETDIAAYFHSRVVDESIVEESHSDSLHIHSDEALWPTIWYSVGQQVLSRQTGASGHGSS